MGMDGLSIANTGVVKESTSAEIASKTEQAIQAEQANSNRQVNGLSVNQRVREKDESDEQNKKQGKNPTQETFGDLSFINCLILFFLSKSIKQDSSLLSPKRTKS